MSVVVIRPPIARQRLLVPMILALGLVPAGAPALRAQPQEVPYGEWHTWGGDLANTRYSPLDQINAANFDSLEVAWVWRGDNFGREADYILRSTPVYAQGTLYTVAGQRRTVVAIDPANGETLWMFREPHTVRYERSERFNYGRGVTYSVIDGKGVIYVVTPAYFLHALDATTGLPLEGFGAGVPLRDFPETGTVDLLSDLGHDYDPYRGIDPKIGTITNSHPPIVVNGVVIVPSSGSRGRYQTRNENVPGDILAYDARTGRHLWTFHAIPRPGEYGHETWENDAWATTGNVNPWAGFSADAERGIVYAGLDAVMNDYYGGFHPGDNLFSTSIVALDVRSGERVWHFQLVHHDIWDFDPPVPPALVDIVVNGERIPVLVQTTKQGMVFAFDRVTGEPIWPIEERPVPASIVPGERTAATQPFPTKPAPYEMQGLADDDLIDFTPELRALAIKALEGFERVPNHPYNPPVHRGNREGARGTITCPGNQGGTNIPGGSAVDPETGILYVASIKACASRILVAGEERDVPDSPFTVGTTLADWVSSPAPVERPEGLPLFKPPYGRITAIDLNTGEHLWWIPNGDTPDYVRNHPLLQGIDIPNTGQASHATALVTKTLLIYGEGRNGAPRFHAVDKRTGRRVGTIELPGRTSTAPMTFLHEGKQYLVTAVGGPGHPGSLVALRLPSRREPE